MRLPRVRVATMLLTICAIIGGDFAHGFAGVPKLLYAGTADSAFETINDMPVLSLDSEEYCIRSSWRLKVSNAEPLTPILLLGTTNGQSWEIPEWHETDANGNLTVEGQFGEGTEASYSLRVQIGTATSNIVSLMISNCTPVGLNGSYLAPSSGERFSDAVASATTHPFGDRRGEGQVYEINKGHWVPEGTYTPFADDSKRPEALGGIDLRGRSFQCDVDFGALEWWRFDAEFFQIGAGRQADSLDPRGEEFFVFIYRAATGFALYMETDWRLYRPETTYYAALDKTRFRVRVDVNAGGTEAVLSVIPLNGLRAGSVHTVGPLLLDSRNDNVTSTSFFAGFTENYSEVDSVARATISNFIIKGVP